MATARRSEINEMAKASDEIKVAALSSAVAALASTVAALSSTATSLASTAITLASTATDLSPTATALSSAATALAFTATALSSAATALSPTATALSSAAVALSSTDVAPSSTATALSSTSLQDMPIEVLDDILMKTVIKEVMEKKLAKSAWIEYASRVIKRLRTVSSQWYYSLTTKWFEMELHRKLMCIDPTAVLVEEIARRQCEVSSFGFARLNSQIYCLDNYLDSDTGLYDDFNLHVFEVHDTTHLVKMIPLPKVKDVRGMAACKRSNTIYVWQADSAEWRSGPAVWHLVLKGDSSFEVLRWPTYAPSGDCLHCAAISEIFVHNFSVLDDGNLLALRFVSYEDGVCDNILSLHRPDGLVIRNIRLSRAGRVSNITTKSNGNFVYVEEVHDGCFIRELDRDGKEIRNFNWLHDCYCYSGCKQLSLDACDRVIFHDGFSTLLILDSELNFLGEAETLDGNENFGMLNADFDKETNELIIMFIGPDDVVLFLKVTV